MNHFLVRACSSAAAAARNSQLIFGVVVLATSCSDAVDISDNTDASTERVVVERVIDGDTIDVLINGAEERVRLIGIDTPEKAIPERGQVADCFGEQATAFTRSLLPKGTAITIERDVEPRDDYGRLLGYVYRAADGIFVNYEIVRYGYAQPLTIPPNDTKSELIVAAAQAAETDDLGLWSACS